MQSRHHPALPEKPCTGCQEVDDYMRVTLPIVNADDNRDMNSYIKMIYSIADHHAPDTRNQTLYTSYKFLRSNLHKEGFARIEDKYVESCVQQGDFSIITEYKALNSGIVSYIDNYLHGANDSHDFIKEMGLHFNKDIKRDDCVINIYANKPMLHQRFKPWMSVFIQDINGDGIKSILKNTSLDVAQQCVHKFLSMRSSTGGCQYNSLMRCLSFIKNNLDKLSDECLGSSLVALTELSMSEESLHISDHMRPKLKYDIDRTIRIIVPRLCSSADPESRHHYIATLIVDGHGETLKRLTKNNPELTTGAVNMIITEYGAKPCENMISKLKKNYRLHIYKHINGNDIISDGTISSISLLDKNSHREDIIKNLFCAHLDDDLPREDESISGKDMSAVDIEIISYLSEIDKTIAPSVAAAFCKISHNDSVYYHAKHEIVDCHAMHEMVWNLCVKDNKALVPMDLFMKKVFQDQEGNLIQKTLTSWEPWHLELASLPHPVAKQAASDLIRRFRPRYYGNSGNKNPSDNLYLLKEMSSKRQDLIKKCIVAHALTHDITCDASRAYIQEMV